MLTLKLAHRAVLESAGRPRLVAPAARGSDELPETNIAAGVRNYESADRCRISSWCVLSGQSSFPGVHHDSDPRFPEYHERPAVAPGFGAELEPVEARLHHRT